MISYFKYLLLIIFCLLTFSCVVIPRKNIQKASEGDPLFPVISKLHHSCFQSQTPQFLANVDSLANQKFSFQMEGVWSENYQKLQIRILGVLGEQYGSFSVNGHVLKIQSYFPSAPNSLNSILQLFATLGARGIRSFLCGDYAFQFEKKEDGVFLDTKSSQRTQAVESFFSPLETKHIYSVFSTLNLQDHPVVVESKATLVDQENSSVLTMDSEFFYGPFSQKAPVIFNWIGSVNPLSVTPRSSTFLLGQTNYLISFIDYD